MWILTNSCYCDVFIWLRESENNKCYHVFIQLRKKSGDYHAQWACGPYPAGLWGSEAVTIMNAASSKGTCGWEPTLMWPVNFPGWHLSLL